MKYVLSLLALIAVTGICAFTIYLNGGGTFGLSVGRWIQVQVTK